MEYSPFFEFPSPPLPKNFCAEKISIVGNFLFSSEAAERMLNRQLSEKLNKRIFYFKNNPLQHRNFFEKSQKFRKFWLPFFENAELSLLPCLYEGYKKTNPPDPGLKLRYCGSELLSHVNFARTRKSKISIFSIFSLPKVPKFFLQKKFFTNDLSPNFFFFTDDYPQNFSNFSDKFFQFFLKFWKF